MHVNQKFFSSSKKKKKNPLKISNLKINFPSILMLFFPSSFSLTYFRSLTKPLKNSHPVTHIQPHIPICL